MEVYENGFIPPNRPMEYYKEGKELFIPWKDIIDMRRRDFLGNTQKWGYHIKIRNEYIEYMIFVYTLFEDRGQRVLEKLEELEKELIDQGVDIGKFWIPP